MHRLTIGVTPWLIIFSFILTACADPGGLLDRLSDKTNLTLIDSPIDGVTYVCDGQTLLTSEGGKLSCKSAPIQFRIGVLPIGSIDQFPDDGLVFPQDIVGVSRQAVDDPAVLKLARLLQSLDDDGDISTAISIPAATSAKFTSSDSLEDDLDSLTRKAGVRTVSEAYALSHLRRSTLGVTGITDIRIRISVQDSSPNTLTVGAPVQLTLIGAEVVTSDGSSGHSVTLDGAQKSIEVFLKNAPETLQDLNVLASAEGYVDTGAAVILSADQTEYRLNLKLVKDEEGTIAPGIHVKKQTVTNATGGIVAEPLVAENVAELGTPDLTVSIPAGTELRDEFGELVEATTLNIVRFDPYLPTAIDAYPGGLTVVAEVDGFEVEGEAQEGDQEIQFKTAGFAAINMSDDAGRKVKHFSQPVTVAMQFRIGTQDADGNVVQVGDRIPIWSYNEDTGKWRYEQEGLVQDLDGADFMYDVVYDIDHLTYFNLDWYQSKRCNSASIRFFDEFAAPLTQQALNNLHVRLRIYSNPAIDRWVAVYDNRKLSFGNAPANFAGEFEVYDQSRTELLGRLSFDTICRSDSATGDFEVILDEAPSDAYDRAKSIIERLRNNTLATKQEGITPIMSSLDIVFKIAAEFSAQGDSKGAELFADGSEIVVIYTEAFLDQAETVFEDLVSANEPFIDTNVGGLNGYGCMVQNLRELQINFVNYTTFGGTKPYSLNELLIPYYEQAAREFLLFAPDTLAYSSLGVSEFVRCGFEIAFALQSVGYTGSESLDIEIQDHFEPVVMANVRKMRQDVDDELAGNVSVGDLPPTVGFISVSTEATFQFILDDASSAARQLLSIQRFDATLLQEINDNQAFLQALRDDGKIIGLPN